MAINCQDLITSLKDPSLNQLEQLLLDYFESYYDKELFLRFDGVNYVGFNKLDTFTTVLRKAAVNPARDTIIYNQLVTMYDTAGWVISDVSATVGQQLQFAVKQI